MLKIIVDIIKVMMILIINLTMKMNKIIRIFHPKNLKKLGVIWQFEEMQVFEKLVIL